jgi:RNA 2',3'-cyclic 3'-phosphodiesterase
VMWCGPDRPDPGLVGLADRLEDAVTRAGLPAEPRPFVPHVTLARRVGRCPRCVWPAPLEWTVADLVLAFGRQGRVPRYVQHRRWSLAPDPSIDPSSGL